MLPRRALLSSSLSVSNSDATILSLSLSLSLKLFLFSLFSFLYFFGGDANLIFWDYIGFVFFSVVEGAYVATTSYIGFIRHRIFKYFIYCLRKLTVCQRCTTKMILFSIYLIWLGVWSTEKWHFLLFLF